jgi:hypothetical protein
MSLLSCAWTFAGAPSANRAAMTATPSTRLISCLLWMVWLADELCAGGIRQHRVIGLPREGILVTEKAYEPDPGKLRRFG